MHGSSYWSQKIDINKWEVFTDCAREPTGIDVLDWATEVEARGAGEILITSIDQEGTRKGFDIKLIKEITKRVSIPVICSGGYGKDIHMLECSLAGADGIAFADVLHIQKKVLRICTP